MFKLFWNASAEGTCKCKNWYDQSRHTMCYFTVTKHNAVHPINYTYLAFNTIKVYKMSSVKIAMVILELPVPSPPLDSALWTRCTISPYNFRGPLHKGLRLLKPQLKSAYPCIKPITVAHQTFLGPSCHKKSARFIGGVVHRGGVLWHHKPIGPLSPSFTSKSENVKSWPSAMGGQKRDLTALDDSAKSGKNHYDLCNGPLVGDLGLSKLLISAIRNTWIPISYM